MSYRNIWHRCPGWNVSVLCSRLSSSRFPWPDREIGFAKESMESMSAPSDKKRMPANQAVKTDLAETAEFPKTPKHTGLWNECALGTTQLKAKFQMARDFEWYRGSLGSQWIQCRIRLVKQRRVKAYPQNMVRKRGDSAFSFHLCDNFVNGWSMLVKLNMAQLTKENVVES